LKVAAMSVELIDSMGSDISVVNAARVSFHKESVLEDETMVLTEHDAFMAEAMSVTGRKYAEGQIIVRGKRLADKDKKLLTYLARHKHWTPFGHAFLSFRIKAPIFVARQLGKHQVGLVWNEVSRRYVDEEPEFYFPDTWRKRAANVKQGSSSEGFSEAVLENRLDDMSCLAWRGMRSEVEKTLQLYQDMLILDVCPEQARMVLPQNTMTEWIWSGSLAAFARVCKLRLDLHTQLETLEVAAKLAALVPNDLEHSWGALMENS